MLLANFDRKEHLQHRAVSLRQHGFLVINDLTAGCLLHKFVDDTTLSEIIPKGETSSNMSSLVEDILHWSQCNLMNINWNKTKELVLGSNLAKNFCRELCVDGNIVERVSLSYLVLLLMTV